jgi:hypothetical protein
MTLIVHHRPKTYFFPFLSLSPEVRQRIFTYLLTNHGHETIQVLRLHRGGQVKRYFAIQPRSLSAQVLRTCSQIFREAHPILYSENTFTLVTSFENTKVHSIPITLTRGNFCTMRRISISIQSARLLQKHGDLQHFISVFPLLETLAIDGNLLRTIHMYWADEYGVYLALQRCVDQSLGLLLAVFGGIAGFRKFLAQNPRLEMQYTFGTAIDLILPSSGLCVKDEPFVSGLKWSSIGRD